MFGENYKFDPALWEDRKQFFAGGGKIKRNDKYFRTLEDYASQIYDEFEKIYRTSGEHFICGPFGIFNKIVEKNQHSLSLDGSCFVLLKREFIETLDQYCIERIFSFVCHYHGINECKAGKNIE